MASLLTSKERMVLNPQEEAAERRNYFGVGMQLAYKKCKLKQRRKLKGEEEKEQQEVLAAGTQGKGGPPRAGVRSLPWLPL